MAYYEKFWLIMKNYNVIQAKFFVFCIKQQFLKWLDIEHKILTKQIFEIFKHQLQCSFEKGFTTDSFTPI